MIYCDSSDQRCELHNKYGILSPYHRLLIPNQIGRLFLNYQPNRNQSSGDHNNYGTLYREFPTQMECICPRSQQLWNVICTRPQIRRKCSISVVNLRAKRPYNVETRSSRHSPVTRGFQHLSQQVHNNCGTISPRSQQYRKVIQINLCGWSDFA